MSLKDWKLFSMFNCKQRLRTKTRKSQILNINKIKNKMLLEALTFVKGLGKVEALEYEVLKASLWLQLNKSPVARGKKLNKSPEPLIFKKRQKYVL